MPFESVWAYKPWTSYLFAFAPSRSRAWQVGGDQMGRRSTSQGVRGGNEEVQKRCKNDAKVSWFCCFDDLWQKVCVWWRIYQDWKNHWSVKIVFVHQMLHRMGHNASIPWKAWSFKKEKVPEIHLRRWITLKAGWAKLQRKTKIFQSELRILWSYLELHGKYCSSAVSPKIAFHAKQFNISVFHGFAQPDVSRRTGLQRPEYGHAVPADDMQKRKTRWLSRVVFSEYTFHRSCDLGIIIDPNFADF